MSLPDFPAIDSAEIGSGLGGSVAYFISAVIQAGGLFAQSEILKSCAAMLQSFGVLLFIVSLMGAIASVVFFGAYKRAAWLVLSPVIFLAVINTKVPVNSALERIGERFRRVGDTQVTFEKFVQNPKGSDAQISFVFEVFDKAVSTVMKQLSALLSDPENRAQLVALGRERVLANVMTAQAVTPELRKLVTLGIVGDCGELMRLHAARVQAEVEKKRLEQIEAAAKDAPTKLAVRRKSVDSVLSMRNARITELEQRRVVPDPDVRNYIVELVEQAGPKDAARQTLPKEINDKLNNIRKNLSGPISCQELWDDTLVGFYFEAQKVLELQAKGAAAEVGGGVDWRLILDHAQKVVGTPGKANEVIATYLLRNTMLGMPHDKLHSQLFGRVYFDAFEVNNLFDRVARSGATAGFVNLHYFSASIPYIQGLLLYFFSILFPFFALLILIPSRAKGVFLWMGLWVWVKSWEVGFAMVDVIRELLWQYYSRGADITATDINWNEPSAVFQVLNAQDPLASFETFFSLMELITISIPFVTAHLCLGANSFYGVFRGSIDKTGGLFRNRFNSGTRRGDATSLDIRMSQLIAKGGLEAVDKKMKESGGTGGVTANGVVRSMAGDGTLLRAMHGWYQDGAYQARMDQVDLRVISAQNTTRTMTYSSGAFSGPLSARINRFQEPMVARYFYQGHNTPIPGLPISKNPGDESTSNPRGNANLMPGDGDGY